MRTPTPEDSDPTPLYRLDMSTLLGLVVPPECVPGIEASAELLRRHARNVEAYVYSTNADEDGEPES